MIKSLSVLFQEVSHADMILVTSDRCWVVTRFK